MRSQKNQLPSKAPHDPIADALDGLLFQSQSSCVHNVIKSCSDMDMTRQYSPLSDSVEVLIQHSSDSMQTCSELTKYLERTSALPGYEARLAESEYPEISQEYLNPVAVYMEELFFTKATYISIISIVFQVYQASCKENRAESLYQRPLRACF